MILPKIKNQRLRVLIFILACFVGSRLLMVLVFLVTKGTLNLFGIVENYNQWDAEWYKSFVQALAEGKFYIREKTGEGMWAFFPLYPLIVALFRQLSPEAVSTYLIGSSLSSIFFCAAEYVTYEYIMLTRKNVKVAYWLIFLLSFGLYSFYFSVTYTESLYLLLLSLCFYLLKKKNYLAMGLCGALLSLTRNTGVLFVFVIAADRIMDYCKFSGKKSVGGFFRENFGNPRLVLGVALVPLGLFVYMLFLRLTLGDGLAFVHVQTAWSRYSTNFIRKLGGELITRFPAGIQSQIFMAVGLFLLYQAHTDKRFEELILPLMVMVLAGASGFTSIPRFMVASFSVVLAFADKMAAMTRLKQGFIALPTAAIELVMCYHWLLASVWLI